MLASAIATSMRGLRANIRASHEFSGGDLRHAHRITVIAPMIRSRRISRWPIFDGSPELLLSATRMMLGHQPEPGRKVSPFPECAHGWAKASIAMAVIGPIPGIDISRAEASERFASDLSVFSKPAIRAESTSICSR